MTSTTTPTTIETTLQEIIDGTPALRRWLRLAAGLVARDTRPVAIVEGDGAPRVAGDSYYWTTPSGKTIVHHHSAYGWPTWYHASTRRVEVGATWLVREGARHGEYAAVVAALATRSGRYDDYDTRAAHAARRAAHAELASMAIAA